MVKIDVSGYGAGLQSATKTATGGLYINDGTAALGENLGLRQDYRWGLINSCAYTKDAGACNSTTFVAEFKPLQAILSDTPWKFYQQ